MQSMFADLDRPVQTAVFTGDWERTFGFVLQTHHNIPKDPDARCRCYKVSLAAQSTHKELG